MGNGPGTSAVWSSDANTSGFTVPSVELPVRSLRLRPNATNRAEIVVRGQGTLARANLLAVISGVGPVNTTQVRLQAPSGAAMSTLVQGAAADGKVTVALPVNGVQGQRAAGRWRLEVETSAGNAVLTDYALDLQLSDCRLDE